MGAHLHQTDALDERGRRRASLRRLRRALGYEPTLSRRHLPAEPLPLTRAGWTLLALALAAWLGSVLRGWLA